MFNTEELVLLAAAGDPGGLVQSRRLKSEMGWIRTFAGLVKGGYLKPISENVPEPGPGDYLLSVYQITAKGRRAAGSFSKQGPSDEEEEDDPISKSKRQGDPIWFRI